MKTCFFAGHRDAPDGIQGRLDALVRDLVETYGVTEFIVGHRGNFDRMAALAVRRAKAKYSGIRAFRLLAYQPEGDRVPLPDLFDGFYYPLDLAGVPKRGAIVRANQIALDGSDAFVVYAAREGGNTAALLRRARRMEKAGRLMVWNLA